MTTARLGRGERAPDMVLENRQGDGIRYYAHAGGRAALLVFATEGSVEQISSLAAGLEGIGTDRLTVHVVGPPDLALNEPPFPTLVDADGRAAGAYRTTGIPTAYLLDPNLRVRATYPFTDGASLAETVTQRLAETASPDRPPQEIATQAPLLVVPDVLTPQECTELVDVWAGDHAQTGVEASTGAQRGEQLSATLKRRSDHIVTEPTRSRALATTVGRRVMPELFKAFAYRGTRFEGFKIACYESTERGFFSAHRDNLSPSTAHRRFALTLNLNDEYEGGQLRFPEYGPDLYRPPPGAALLFSCSHLHEVLDVTAGRRFVLLSFVFHDPPAQPAK
ncbi:MAG: 2OG-Fe(II) oxygenase [Nitriliruptorales bacterium]|nr:2OG-Fe(II) oxygenase [Nitriliruptorales bacterium]